MSFIWSQSALKDLEKESTCPARWKGQWIDKLFNSFSSEAVNYGNYFEYLCIGGSAHGDAVVDLPRLANGNKSITQRRIESQAEMFKVYFDKESPNYLGYTITDTQLKLSGNISGIPIEGTLDILSDYNNLPCILDLKLTEDLDNDRTEYGWGNSTEDIDLLQQVLYQELYFQQFGIRPPMHLLVFEHGTKQRSKLIRLNISEYKRTECFERFEAGSNVVNLYSSNKWSMIPTEKECKNCKLECIKRFDPNPKIKIIIEDINY